MMAGDLRRRMKEEEEGNEDIQGGGLNEAGEEEEGGPNNQRKRPGAVTSHLCWRPQTSLELRGGDSTASRHEGCPALPEKQLSGGVYCR